MRRLDSAIVRTLLVCALQLAWLGVGNAQSTSSAERYPFAPGQQQADDFAVHETSGPAILIGVGQLYAGVGAQLAYQFALKERALGLVPHLGAGYVLGADGLPRSPGLRGGVLCAYGRSQRWLADLAFGALEGHELRLHGIPAARRAVHGVSLALGFEAIDAFGVIAHVLLGPYYLTDRGVTRGERLGIALGLGIGWKPW